MWIMEITILMFKDKGLIITIQDKKTNEISDKFYTFENH